MISLVGRVVGDFRLDSLIGSGNLGSVYQATRMSDNSSFAVKVVHDRLAGDPGFPDRFHRVVGASARLAHPNIVRVETFGSTAGEHFIAMQLLARGSLRTMMERREDRPSLQRAVELIRQAAEALGSAHAQGILHRDVKPENIMLARSETGTASSTVCVCDFGMMQLIDTGVTVVGALTPGSPRYMSPEQCSGRPCDARSDIYSLGVVLYEVATGYPPFQVQTLAEAIEKHTSVKPAAPRSVNSAIPVELERIILKCLAKKPDERYQSALALASDLGNVVSALSGAKGPRVVVDATQVSQPQRPPNESVHEGGKIRVRFSDEDSGRGGSSPSGPTAPRAPVAKEGDRIKVHLSGPAVGKAPPRRSESTPAKGGAAARDQKPVGRAGESRLLKFSIDRPIVTLIPGQPTVLRATLFNGTKIVDHFNLTVEGVPANWVQLPPAPPQLNPGDRTAINLTVLVPKIPESHAKTYAVVVRVTAMRQTTESATCDCEWTVTPFVTSSIALTPSRARAWRRTTFGVRIKNDGNAPARYKLIANDDEAVLKYRFGEQEVTLGPGDAAALKVDVRSKVRWLGTTEPRTFMVRADPVANADGTPPVPQTPPIAPGQYLHRAIIPLWAPPVLVMALAALWFFFLKDRGKVDLELTPRGRVQVAVGATSPVKAVVKDKKKGEAIDSLAKQVRFSIDDSTIARMNDSGGVRGLKVGSTVLTASYNKVRTTLEVEVSAAQIASFVLAPPQLNLVVGGRGALQALAKDANGNPLKRDVMWTSSNPMVVSAAGNGVVIASDTGVATVTAISEGRTASAIISVKPNAGMIAKAKESGGGGDCTTYDPAALKVVHDKTAGWIIGDGSNTLLTLDEELDARRALALTRGYKTHCYLGRTNKRPNRSSFIVEYWMNPSGAPINVDNEDCVRFNPGQLKVMDNGQQGFALMDGKRPVLFADSQADAQKIWEVAQQNTAQCFIGRGNHRQNQRDYVVQYWR